MSHQIPNNLKYTADHEWAKIENDLVVVGITDFAQASLGEIVFLELPEVGKVLNKGDAFGVVESIKSVSDLYSPISGEIVSVNSSLSDTPEKLNTSVYESWLVKIKSSNKGELSQLLDAVSYKKISEGD